MRRSSKPEVGEASRTRRDPGVAVLSYRTPANLSRSVRVNLPGRAPGSYVVVHELCEVRVGRRNRAVSALGDAGSKLAGSF